MVKSIREFVQSTPFQNAILLVILAAAVLVGAETYPRVMEQHGDKLHLLNEVILWIFVAEAALKMAQHGRYWYRYFQDPWNLFDFSIVAVCFLPLDASYAAVLRLARILRALRLLTVMPQLQLIVGALIRSIPSMGYVGCLLLLNFYVYAVMGVFLFRENDPVHFENLPTAMLTLFRVVTLEDWTDVMYIQMYGSNVYGGPDAYVNTTGLEVRPYAMPLVGAAYFVSFVMFGTMIMLNLFIGVILNSMDQARNDQQRETLDKQRAAGLQPTLDADITALEHQLQDALRKLHTLRIRLDQAGKPG